MNQQHPAIRYSLIGIAFLLGSTAQVFSQQSQGPAPVDRTVNAERARQQEMSSREWQLRNFGNQPGTPADRRRAEALMAQTAEDFDRIMTRHNEIARALSSGKPLDFNFVTEAASEIRKRASRLQSTLALREDPTQAEVTKKAAHDVNPQMKDELIKLCQQIRSFVTNPIIENPNTIDAEKLKLAKRDLESVIQLSEQIKKDASRSIKHHD